MGIKKQLAMGVATAALGLSLVGGGTYAYFNDVETTSNTFAAGTLDLTAKPSTIIDVKNMKPGDWMEREFTLENSGTLDISKVILNSSYQVVDAKGDNNGEDFGKYIEVQFLANQDKKTVEVYETTLDQLTKANVTNRDILGWLFGGEKSGLKAGTSDKFIVKFTFNDNGQDQNKFQGDQLKLNWSFDAKQTDGESI